MNQNEAAQRREAVIVHPYTNEAKVYTGSSIHAVTEKGIVIAVGQSRLFYPWHRITVFTYHVQDEAARKIIQGW